MRAPSRARGFAARIVAWHARHGRRGLPWQKDGDPYRVWLSEVMLQQTQIGTVLPYYARFCARFPDVRALAAAPLDDVLAMWAGLGYYARARNLHACARQVVDRLGGDFPTEAGTLQALPGIGRSTAAAIAAFCAGERVAILDGNVKRVLARHFAVEGDPATPAVRRRLWAQAEALLPPRSDMPAYTQGLMDLGATVCTRRRPNCPACPLAASCAALASGRVDQLPTPRLRRASPQRRAWALVALHERSVLVQQRAPAGLWGGMLALPQFDSAAALRQAAQAIDSAAVLRPLPARRIAFTHFTLTLMPRRLDLRAAPSAAEEPTLRWLPLAQVDSAALPAPIRSLLSAVAAAAAPRAARRGKGAGQGRIAARD